MRRTPEQLRAEQGKLWTTIGNLVRRVVLTAIATQASFEGYDQLDGNPEGTKDTEGVDVFGGMFTYAKPGAADEAEALMFHVGGAPEHRAIGALRNQAARQRYLDEHGDINAGESVTFSSDGKTRVLITNTGMEITLAAGAELVVKRKGGSAERVVLKSEFDGHTHGSGTLLDSMSGACTGSTAGAGAVSGSQAFQTE